MFRSRNTFVAFLTAGCLSLGTLASAQKAPNQSADIVVHSVKVQTTKKGGEPWDVFGGAPDLKVFIRNTKKGGAKHTTQVKKDTFDTSFGERTIRVSVGEEIEVIVYDEDGKFNDQVGEKTVTVTEEMLQKRGMKWEFDRVISLTLEFEP